MIIISKKLDQAVILRDLTGDILKATLFDAIVKSMHEIKTPKAIIKVNRMIKLIAHSKIIPLVFTLSLNVFMGGCVSSVQQQQPWESYHQQALQAKQQGDWRKNQKFLGHALIEADIHGAGPHKMATLWYEYGMATGVICSWHPAEVAFKKTLKLDTNLNGPTYRALYELAKMNVHRENYPKALDYFEQAYVAFDFKKNRTKDMSLFANFLEEFSQTLQQVEQVDKAEKLRRRAQEIRHTIKDTKIEKRNTPYGKFCE